MCFAKCALLEVVTAYFVAFNFCALSVGFSILEQLRMCVCACFYLLARLSCLFEYV
jgi:hypothetical protein